MAINRDELSVVQVTHISPDILANYSYIKISTANGGEAVLYSAYWNPAHITSHLEAQYPTNYFTDSAAFTASGTKSLGNPVPLSGSNTLVTDIIDNLINYHPEFGDLQFLSPAQQIAFLEEWDFCFLVDNTAITTGNPPVASNLNILLDDGNTKSGSDISFTYDYFDIEGNALDLVNTDVELWCYDTIGGTGTFLSNLTHTAGTTTTNGTKTLDPVSISAAAESKYLALVVTPHATTLPTTGTTEIYYHNQKVVENTAALTLTTGLVGASTFSFDLEVAEGAPYILQFDDGSPDEYYIGDNLIDVGNNHSHNFSSLTTGTVTVCANPDDIRGLQVVNGDLQGVLDLTSLEVLGADLNITNSPDLTGINFATTGSPILNNLTIRDTGITSFNLAAVTGNAILTVRGNPDMLTFDTNLTVTDVMYQRVVVRENATMVSADISNFNSAFRITIADNPVMTTLVMPDDSNVIPINIAITNNLSFAPSCFDLTGLKNGFTQFFTVTDNMIQCFNFPPKSAFDALEASGNYFIRFWAFRNDFSVLNLSNLTNLAGSIRLQSNSSMTNIILPTNPLSGTINSFQIYGTAISGSFATYSLANWAVDSSLLYNNNPLLTSINIVFYNSGEIAIIDGRDTGITTAAGHLGGFNNYPIGGTSINLDYQFSGLSSTEVDNLAQLVDNATVAGTGDIHFENNSPPTAAGLVFINNLIAKGYNVTND